MIKAPWWSLDEGSPPPRRRWWRILRRLPRVIVTLLLVLFVVILLYPFMVVTVPSGQVGVLWKRFSGPGIYCWCILARGTVLDPEEIRGEGLHIIWPWDKIYLYDLRLQSTTQKYNAISSDGVSVLAELNFRYQLAHNSVAVLHKYIGPEYVLSLVAPVIGSEARKVISQYPAEQVYKNREALEEKIRDETKKDLGSYLDKLFQPEASEQQAAVTYQTLLANSIQILDTLVLSIELPTEIVAAINRQAEQFYAIQEYKYRVEREIQESQRKQIEANGIAAFQRTVSQGISDSYLRWQAIQATLALALSPNAKVVVIGSGKDGLPVILGNVDTPPPAGPGPKPGEGGAPAPLTPPTTPPHTSALPSGGEPTTVEGIISRFSDVLRPGGSATPSPAGANSK